MKKIITVLMASILLSNMNAQPQFNKFNITLENGKQIGMVDGYDPKIPNKIIGQNIWQNTMTIEKNNKSIQVDIVYIINDKKILTNVWVGNANSGKENIKMKKRLSSIGYDTTQLSSDIKPILIKNGIVNK